jgi:hypothetical protein
VAVDQQQRKAVEIVGRLGPIPVHGNPNGQLEGRVGAVAVNLDGGAGATLWVKESAPTPMTGWVAK